MIVDTEIVRTVVERLLRVSKPEKIILFGSAASGAMSTDSDLDILVVEHGVRSERQESGRLRAALGNLGVPVDVFAMTPERFEETKHVIGGLAYPANKYGKVIYEAA